MRLEFREVDVDGAAPLDDGLGAANRLGHRCGMRKVERAGGRDARAVAVPLDAKGDDVVRAVVPVHDSGCGIAAENADASPVTMIHIRSTPRSRAAFRIDDIADGRPVEALGRGPRRTRLVIGPNIRTRDPTAWDLGILRGAALQNYEPDASNVGTTSIAVTLR